MNTGYYWVRLLNSEWWEPAFYRSDYDLFFITGQFDAISPDEFEIGVEIIPPTKNTGGE